MTQKLAIFPLQLVVFPGENLNLHIFEPRYRQLIKDAEENGITFCIPTVINGGLLPIATEVRLTEIVNKYPSGESDIRTVGERVFFLEDYWKTYPEKLYPGGECRELLIDFNEDPNINGEIVNLTRAIYRELNIDKTIRSVKDGFRTYDIAHYVGLKLEQEYELLTIRSATERQRFLLSHLINIKPELREGKSMQDRANLNGHFKELVPPKW
ncbi:LON peptidase substrate-binding domain-containing protein [Neolewinella persica]|uniref:LON peptidase substrate-binding domain-containing protein n=1 Tax=Neolewinella persica TaxID=70998 RepID=UPI00036CD180|nr:LON peptidase substrate-binding domain-containing protein [Neolewinella persica]